jgi:hypothetical protein
MTKHNFLAGLVCLFLFFPPCTGSAQTLPAETGDGVPFPEVAVMTFAGNDEVLNAVLRDAAAKEIQGIGKYTPRPVSGEEYPGSLNSPPDKPPAPLYLGNSRYALTGEYHTNSGEDLGHLQLWLWNSRDGSLVLYTDAWNVEDRIDALSYTSYMVSWIFSNIPEEEQSSPLKPASDRVDYTPDPQYKTKKDPLNSWLYVGLRGGGSFRFYTLPELTQVNYSDAPYDFSYEASFQLAFRFLPFMSIQAEAVFTQDRAKFQGPEYHSSGGASWHIFYTDSYTSTSLLFPVTVKFPLVFDPYIISPFGGVYWALPLGKITLDSNTATRKTGEFDYDLAGRLGITAGVDLGMRLGPGILFLDARYGGDFGKIVVQMDDGTTIGYKRAMLSISIGYELALINKRRHAGGN